MIAGLVVWAHAEGPSYHDRLLKAVLQVAIVCRDIQATSRRWADLLGVDPPQIHLTKPGRRS